MADLNIVAYRSSMKHDAAMVPNSYPPAELYSIWQVNTTNELYQPREKPVGDGEWHSHHLGADAHSPVAEPMQGDCPEAGFEWIILICT